MGGEGTIEVAVVDDQRLFTRSLSGLLGMLPDAEVVGFCREKEPDVVLIMDISMPRLDGITATRRITDLLPRRRS